MAKQYVKGAKLTVKGKKVQILSVNADGTATYGNVKKDGTLEQGIAGNLPALKFSPVSATSAVSNLIEEGESVTGYSAVSVEDYRVHSEDSIVFNNFASFKRFIENNVGKAVLTLTEAEDIVIVGNTGNTTIKHRFLNKPRTVTKATSTGFYLEDSFVDYGKASEWVFEGNTAVWSSNDDNMRLVYKITV